MSAHVALTLRLKATGAVFVSDGSLLLREDLVPAASVPAVGATPMAPALESLLGPAGVEHWTRIDELGPSVSSPQARLTRTGIAVHQRYSDYLAGIGLSDLELGTTGLGGIIVLRARGEVVGGVMPLRMPLEPPAPPPPAGARRGRVRGFAAERGTAEVVLQDGTVAHLDASFVVGVGREWLEGALLDVEVTCPASGQPAVSLAWPAGQPRPQREPVVDQGAPVVGIEEAMGLLADNGLVRGLGLTEFERLCEDALGGAVDELGAEEIVEVLFCLLGESTEGGVAFGGRALDALAIAIQDLEEDEPSPADDAAVARAVNGVAQRLGLVVPASELPGPPLDVLGRALALARRRERAYCLSAADIDVVLVRAPSEALDALLDLFEEVLEYDVLEDPLRHERPELLALLGKP